MVQFLYMEEFMNITFIDLPDTFFQITFDYDAMLNSDCFSVDSFGGFALLKFCNSSHQIKQNLYISSLYDFLENFNSAYKKLEGEATFTNFYEKTVLKYSFSKNGRVGIYFEFYINHDTRIILERGCDQSYLLNLSNQISSIVNVLWDINKRRNL